MIELFREICRIMKDLSEVSLNIGSLQAHYSSGSLTPGDVIREVYRRIRALPDNPIWIHLVPEEDAFRAAEALHGTASSSTFWNPICHQGQYRRGEPADDRWLSAVFLSGR